MISIQSALAQATQQLAAHSDSAALDAEVLLCSVLDKQRSHLRAWPDNILSAQQAASFWALVVQRQQGQPIAYIVGQREFWSRDFLVTPDVLIPRPDTEVLIECALALLPPDQPAKLIDLGTGSGIIAITLASERPKIEVTATDISEAALTVAQHNAKQHKIDRIQFYLSNWFNAVPSGLFDLVVSNPPYISSNDPHLQRGDLRFEPSGALIASNNGLSDIQILADQARYRLHPGGYLLIEHGYNQQTAVHTLFTDFRYDNVQTHVDLGGRPRVTSGQWNH